MQIVHFVMNLSKEIHTIAPGYIFKTELQPEDLQNVEISLGWNSDYQEKLLASSTLKWVQSISAGVDQLPLRLFQRNIFYFQMVVASTVNRLHLSCLGIILGILVVFFKHKKHRVT